MIRTISASAIAAAVLTGCIMPLPHAVAFPASVGIVLYGRPQANGSTLYDIGLPSLFSEVVTNPTGHIFQPIGLQSLPNSTNIVGLTQAQALSELVGPWTIARGGFFGFPPPLETYTFSISPFTLDEIFTIPPTITSPANGSTVPTQFAVNFVWPNGVTPPTNRLATWSTNSSIAASSVEVVSGKNSFPVSVSLKSGATQGSLTISVGTTQSLNNHVSPVTTAVTNPTFTYSVGLGFWDLSAPVSVNVTNVPEPNAIVLMSTFMFSGVAVRRRRYSLCSLASWCAADGAARAAG